MPSQWLLSPSRRKKADAHFEGRKGTGCETQPHPIQSAIFMGFLMAQALGRGLGTDEERRSFYHPGVTVLWKRKNK